MFGAPVFITDTPIDDFYCCNYQTLFQSADEPIHHHKSRAEQYSADNIGNPVHTGSKSSYNHKHGKNGDGKDNTPFEKVILDTGVQLYCCRRHNAHREHCR